MILQAAYAYAIPSPETVEWMSGICADLPIVELRAGRGYWAAQLSGSGLSAEAYDVEPPDTAMNVSFAEAVGQMDVWHSVHGLAEYATRAHSADHVLFLCWPPDWGNTMSSEALTSFEETGGERFVYIGGTEGRQDLVTMLSLMHCRLAGAWWYAATRQGAV